MFFNYPRTAYGCKDVCLSICSLKLRGFGYFPDLYLMVRPETLQASYYLDLVVFLLPILNLFFIFVLWCPEFFLCWFWNCCISIKFAKFFGIGFYLFFILAVSDIFGWGSNFFFGHCNVGCSILFLDLFRVAVLIVGHCSIDIEYE